MLSGSLTPLRAHLPLYEISDTQILSCVGLSWGGRVCACACACVWQPGMLASIAGMGVCMVMFIVVLERTNQLGLALISGSVYIFAGALAYISIHVMSCHVRA